MNLFTALANALAAGLSIWESKERNKYRDKLIELKRSYYEEYNKPDGQRSDARLDNLRFELCLLATGFSTSVGAPDPAPASE